MRNRRTEGRITNKIMCFSIGEKHRILHEASFDLHSGNEHEVGSLQNTYNQNNDFAQEIMV